MTCLVGQSACCLWGPEFKSSAVTWKAVCGYTSSSCRAGETETKILETMVSQSSPIGDFYICYETLSQNLRWWDSSWGKEGFSKPGDQSSSLRAHMMRVENWFFMHCSLTSTHVQSKWKSGTEWFARAGIDIYLVFGQGKNIRDEGLLFLSVCLFVCLFLFSFMVSC